MRPLLLVAVVSWLLASAPSEASAQAYVIGPGREAEVLALFAPHALGEEVAEGWVLSNVSIEQTTIVVTLSGSGDPIQLVLHHRSRPTTAPRSASFSFTEEGTSGQVATASLMAAVRDNDDGTFWDGAVLGESAPEVASGLLEAAAAALSSDRAVLERMSGPSLRIERVSPTVSLVSALFALLLAAGSLFVRRAR